MCLIIVNKEPPTERITIYKVVLKYSDRFLSPYYLFEYKAGWNEALYTPKIRNIKAGFIPDKGKTVAPLHVLQEGMLHLYTSLEVAHQYLNSDRGYILEGYGEPQDFIAWGNAGDVGFKKVYILPESIQKALK